MKWLAFTVTIVGALVALGVWSVMPPGVVWEEQFVELNGPQEPHMAPFCSRCRAPIRPYSRQCPECDRALRWTSTDVECAWCLSKKDVDYLRDSYYALDITEKEHQGLLKQFPRAYFESIEPGDCANCAGLGKVKRGDAEVTCPVCRGTGDCIACDGDREVVVGDEGAHKAWLARVHAWATARRRSELTRLPIARSTLVDDDVEALRGYAEVEQLVDERGENLVKTARARAALAFEALEKAQRAEKVSPGSD